MKLLITGGCGFIGSNFIRFMLKKYKQVKIINLDKLTYCGNPKSLENLKNDKRYTFVRGDICDKGVVKRLVPKVNMVINFAAESHVDRSIRYPDDFLRTNVEGVKVLLEESKTQKLKRFIQIGTDEVYGSVSKGLSKEDDPLNPNSPYSASKAAGDLLALSYYSTYGLPVVVTRSSNNFGPYQYPEKVVPLFITNLIEGKKVPLYGKGDNIRDWLFVEDNCRAIDVVMRSGRAGNIYNIGGGVQLDNKKLTLKLLNRMDKNKSYIDFVNDRPGHDKRYALDSSKVGKLGWEVKDNFDKNLEATIKWYSENKSWWRPLKEKAEIIKW